MYCKNCGSVIENTKAVICVGCGTKKGDGNNYCPDCGEKTENPSADVCLKCGVRLKSSISNIMSSTAQKNKLVAGLLALFLGSLGIHRFYLGHTTIGIIQLVLSLAGFLTCGITTIAAGVWALIDCIFIFTDKLVDASGASLE